MSETTSAITRTEDSAHTRVVLDAPLARRQELVADIEAIDTSVDTIRLLSVADRAEGRG